MPTTNSTATAPIDEFDAPDDLLAAERAVWLKLAPFAFANRTLTRATALSFEMLCRNVVLERAVGVGVDAGGADHRGLIQRVDAELLAFNLRPCGKAIYQPAEDEQKPASPLSRFTTRKRA